MLQLVNKKRETTGEDNNISLNMETEKSLVYDLMFHGDKSVLCTILNCIFFLSWFPLLM